MKLIIALAVCLNFPDISNNQDHETYNNLCRVDMVHTPLSPVKLAETLKEGHYQKFGTYPNNKRLAVGWAQVALENGKGYYTYNYNFGKIKSGKTRPHYVQKHRFRAHRNAIEGAADYWNIVDRICKRSLTAFNIGAPERAAHILYGCGYYGANKTKYGQEMRKLYSTALRKIIPKLKQKGLQD